MQRLIQKSLLFRDISIAGASICPKWHWPFLILGVLSACLSAFFGDITMDKAVSAGFSAAPIKRHETFAMTTRFRGPAPLGHAG